MKGRDEAAAGGGGSSGRVWPGHDFRRGLDAALSASSEGIRFLSPDEVLKSAQIITPYSLIHMGWISGGVRNFPSEKVRKCGFLLGTSMKTALQQITIFETVFSEKTVTETIHSL